MQTSRSAARPARYSGRTSPIDRTNGSRQSPLACATDSWRTEDAQHRHLRTHCLANSARASPASHSDVEDLSPQPSQSNGVHRFLYGADDHHEGVVRVHRPGPVPSPGVALQHHRASERRLDIAADCEAFVDRDPARYLIPGTASTATTFVYGLRRWA